MRSAAKVLGVLLSLVGVAAGAGPASAVLPRVTLLGDSVAASLKYSAEGRAAVTGGYDLVLDAEVCRRLVAPSCSYQGFAPPTALQAVQARSGSQLGKLVVVDVGYNDLANRYAADLDAVMAALVARGVEHVIWLTLRAEGDYAATYVKINAIVRAAPARWPQLKVADWDTASAGRPWFDRNAHLNKAGAAALGAFVRAELDGLPTTPPAPPVPDRCDPREVTGVTAPPMAALAPEPSPPALVTPITPVRVLDTRAGLPDDGIERPLGLGRRLELVLAGRAGIPADATGVVVNVAVDRPCGPGFLTVHPAGTTTVPLSSTSNFVAGEVVASLAIVRLGDRGGIGLYSSAQTHAVVDVVGYLRAGTGSRLMATEPFRLYDSRPASIAGGTEVTLAVRGRASVPSSPDVSGAVLNLTVTEPGSGGYLTMYPGPCNPSRRPLASSLNYATGRTIANLVVAALGADGSVCVFASTSAKVVVDVEGWLGAAGAAITTANPQRLLDTRPGLGALDPTAKGRLSPFVPRVLPASVLAGAGSSPSALLLNVTVVGPAGDGFITVYPCQAGWPLASNVNYRAGEVRPNLVEVRPDASGHVCVVSQQATDLVVDVDGWAR